MRNILLMAAMCCLLCSCNSDTPKDAMAIDSSQYTTTIGNKKVNLYTLKNDNVTIQITNYGGCIVSMLVPDNQGIIRNICWREPSLAAFKEAGFLYSGVIIGRFANRIGREGRININGKEYQLSIDSRILHSHGGQSCFGFRVWDAEQGVNEKGEPTLALSLFSKDGEDGYPGDMNVKTLYTLTKENSLKIEFEATTNASTIVNLTSHPFFNLHGSMLESASSHRLTVNADYYTPSAPNGLLTGEVASVTNTPLDFRTPHIISERLNEDHPQINRCWGYDTNYLINRDSLSQIAYAAELYEPSNGITVKVYSDQEALQFYGGPNSSIKAIETRDETSKPIRYGVALEAQGSPNSPNIPTFRSPILNPNEIYKRTIIYNFSVQ